MTSSALYSRDSPEAASPQKDVHLNISTFQLGLKRVESRYPDENFQKDESRLTFDRPIVESKIFKEPKSVYHSYYNPASSSSKLKDSYVKEPFMRESFVKE